jgi:hypothetical protein
VSGSRLSAVDVMALAHEELAEASRGYLRSRQLQVVTFTASVVSIFVSSQYAYYPALFALISQGVSWTLRIHASSQQSIGDEGRMRGLLLDALGPTTEHIDLADLVNRISSDAQARAVRSVDPNYFASKAPQGVVRLRDHLQENAFWGKCLYGSAADRYLRLLGAFGVAAIAVILVAIPLAPHNQSLVVARLLVTALSFGAALTQINEILSWRSAKSKIETVDRRLEVLATFSEAQLMSQGIEALFAVFGDYCVATATSPPVPGSIYSHQRQRLNALWGEMRQVTQLTIRAFSAMTCAVWCS